MKKQTLLVQLCLGLGSLLGCGGPADLADLPGDATPGVQQAALVHSPVIPVNERVYGLSQATWSARFWQQLLPYPAAINPILDQTGTYGGVGQYGPVWFLSGPVIEAGSATVVKRYTVPADKTIFVPILNYLNDYPCPDPGFKPAPGQSLEDFLQEGAKGLIDLVTDVSAKVDGVPVQDIVRHRQLTDLLLFRADISLRDAGFDACITGRVQPGVNDGYVFLLRPLPRGEHRVEVRAKLQLPTASLKTETDFILTVR